MQELADTELLRQYAEQNSEMAFTELVTRYVGLVYSAALRKTGNPHAAEEITQAVFIILAKKARSLRRETILSGWLYQAARLTSANYLRTEIRRVRREQEAYMQSLGNETEVWAQIEPLLEDAMGRLNDTERNAIVLRFFEGKSFQEIGLAFGGSENAAKKRVIRALEKLRAFFARRGVTSTAAIIGGMLAANSVKAAPIALANLVSGAAIAKGAAASFSTVTLTKTASKAITWAKYKLAVGVASSCVVLGTVATIATIETGGNSGAPDPLALLKNVAAARERIKSGEMEFVTARHDFKYAIRTNYGLLKVSFDGEKRRFEQLDRESTLVSMAPDAGKIVDAKRIELNGDDDKLASLGLITLWNAHYRTIYDGQATTWYFPQNRQTDIIDPNRGNFTYCFDPRVFGLTVNGLLSYSTIEGSMMLKNGKPVLIGKEDVDGVLCWHVQTQIPMIVDSIKKITVPWTFDFWIDAAHPTHIIKLNDPNRGGVVMSKYDSRDLNDPLPVEVYSIDHYGGKTNAWEHWFYRRNTRYNVPIDAKAFTLAGLDMPNGTSVVDDRKMMRIGYWNGKALQKDFPRNVKEPRPETAPLIENTFEGMAKAPTDSSFVDKRIIVIRRSGYGIALAALICLAIYAVKRVVAKG